jgi:TDG/mug DNA glycosylase family protein
MKQYYADPRNQFWSIVYGAFGEASIDVEYEHRAKFLLDHNIAIWDMFHVADRKGSIDANIKNEISNDIPDLLQKYPGIKRIILAGRKAARSFQTHFPNLAVETVNVPSSSPTPGRYTKTLDEKIQIWKAVLTAE